MLAEASPETIDVMLREARAHLQNARLSDAEGVCQRILKTAADNIDAIYTLAVSQRMQRQVPAALKTPAMVGRGRSGAIAFAIAACTNRPLPLTSVQ